MGKVLTRLKLTNLKDLHKFELGLIKQNEVRSIEKEALVDTGATLLVLPEDVVELLGLEKVDEAIVNYADGRKKRRDVVGVVEVRIDKRSARVDAIREERGTKILLGQIPLEEMDLVVDPRTGKLGPRPESPDTPLIEIL